VILQEKMFLGSEYRNYDLVVCTYLGTPVIPRLATYPRIPSIKARHSSENCFRTAWTFVDPNDLGYLHSLAAQHARSRGGWPRPDVEIVLVCTENFAQTRKPPKIHRKYIFNPFIYILFVEKHYVTIKRSP
jgi:hypothetical protein